MNIIRWGGLAILLFILWRCTMVSPHKKSSTTHRMPSNPNYPKREFRGVWIATVDNIDWPTRKTLSTEKQQEEFVKLLNHHSKTGLNAVLVQVRAASDAFYARSQEPWSEWLTGQQGKAPDSYYDPLRFMIEESHNRNLEFHAWLNLNRGIHKSTKSVVDGHITQTKPEWFLKYDGQTLYNFGIPEVRAYLVDIVKGIVKNYDVDGIHFDDYFYPYTVNNQQLKDEDQYKRYGKGFASIKEWRRNNVDLLIHDISKAIEKEKKWVKFGVSPFGVWRNARVDPAGSKTEAGQTSYDDLFADTRKWAQLGWIDYVAPQIYFSLEHPKVPYQPLADWWMANHGNRLLYVGHALYKIDREAKEPGWKSAKQISRQVRYNRNSGNIGGSIFFSSNSLIKNSLGITDSLKNLYNYKALQPSMPWKDGLPPLNPEKLAGQRIGNQQITIRWRPALRLPRDGDETMAFVIYRFQEGAPLDIENPKNILAILKNDKNYNFLDKTVDKGISYQYLVTALDRLQNESLPSNTIIVK
jgi:uncharacterized lipoprotein YddW (UPF0748 family)